MKPICKSEATMTIDTENRKRTEGFVRSAVKAKGYGEVKEIIHRFTILHSGWEMDNDGWVVKMADGSLKEFTTCHGSLCPWDIRGIEDKINETADSLKGLREALDILKPRKALDTWKGLRNG